MDPITATALTGVLLKVGEGVTGEAGRQLWESLTGVVKSTFGRRAPEVAVARELAEGDPDRSQVESLARTLAAESERDAELAGELRAWMDEAERAAGGGVTQIIGGSAQIGGDVVQARDIQGGITFGR